MPVPYFLSSLAKYRTLFNYVSTLDIWVVAFAWGWILVKVRVSGSSSSEGTKYSFSIVGCPSFPSVRVFPADI
jgi:hypothetical protein